MIYALHGTIKCKSMTIMGHRNLVQTDVLRTYIIDNKNAIGSTKEVIAGTKKIAFTIDDGTKASFEAAVLFAELGIPCIWFVNGKNIKENAPYSFAYLNELVERCEDSIVFGDETIKFDDFHKKRKVRKIIKEYMHLNFPTDELRLRFLHELITVNQIQDFEIPAYAQHVSLDEILFLKGCSVSVMNHLWEHNFTDQEDIEILKSNIRQGAEWLQTYFDNPINEHALPYGLYSESLQGLTEDIIYLLDNRYDIGEVLPNVFNRIAF